MSGFGPGLDPLECRRVEVAVRRLRGVADEVDGVAARVAVPLAAGAWAGGARRRHDQQVHGLATDLRAVAAVLRDVADDAATALVVAVRVAEQQAVVARLAARSGGADAVDHRHPAASDAGDRHPAASDAGDRPTADRRGSRAASTVPAGAR